MKKLQKVNRKYLTLLEVLIAISLMSVLIVAMLGFYSHQESLQKEIAQQRKKTFYTLYLQNRLGRVLPFVKFGKNEEWFYTSTEGESPSLVFVYDNGIDGNPLFTNLVLGKLYVDPARRLTFVTWPLPKKNFTLSPPMRKEILQENVKELFFQFFHPPPREKSEKKERTIPPIVKIQIVTDDNTTILAYVLPNATEPIFYGASKK